MVGKGFVQDSLKYKKRLSNLITSSNLAYFISISERSPQLTISPLLVNKLCSVGLCFSPSISHNFGHRSRMQNDAQDLHPRGREGPMLQELSAPAYLLTTEEIILQLATDPDNGLSEEEAKFRLTKYGLNELETSGHVSATRILMKQVFNAMVLVKKIPPFLFPFLILESDSSN